MGRVDIKLGYSCNDACIHCVVDDFRDALRAKGLHQDKTTRQFIDELSEARGRADTVVLTGGEPTIRRDLVDIVRHARSLGYRILVQSNGRRFSDPSFVDALVAASDMTFCIALHGPTAEVHDAVTRRGGAFEETVAGIGNLLARRQAVTGKIVLSRVNTPHLVETVELFHALGVRYVSIAYPHALGMARKMWDEVVPRYVDVLPFLHRALDAVHRLGMSADAETFTYCHMEGYEHFISEIQQQLETYVELQQYGCDDAVLDWSVVRRDIKRKFPPCRACRFDAICEGPWTEYAERYGGDEFRPLYGVPVTDVRAILDGTFRSHLAAFGGRAVPISC